MDIISSLFSFYFRKRIADFEHAINHAQEMQHHTLLDLLDTACDTEWGLLHGYESIKNYETYRDRVPLQDYESLKGYIERNMSGEQNLLWPSEIRWFAKSSGTTSDKSKFIPVSYESLDDCHYKGGKDVLTIFCHNHPQTEIFSGKGLVIGGSHKINSNAANSFYGDLSAVMMMNIPFWVDFLRTPDRSIALMEEWEEKIEKMALATVNQDVTNIAGVPTWTIVLIEKLFEITGKNNLHDIWPNLELYIHGGVSFLPYQDRFNQLIRKSDFTYLETYNASEGFFGIQESKNRSDMLLLPHYGIFYEFVQAAEINEPNPKAIPLWEVETMVNYAMVISTNGGLWRYVLGDTVMFTERNPYRFRITGRTKLFINAFGEELIIDNTERAIAEACLQTQSVVADYTVAPLFFEEGKNGAHEWFVEFEQAPLSLDAFKKILDDTLKSVNSDYEAKRHKDIAVRPPELRVLPKGTFKQWLKLKSKLGGQHKVPRLSNNRIIVEEIQSVLERYEVLSHF
jgi:hypothetical protein